MAPIGMFELAPVGIPIVIVGLAYMMTIGRRLLPDRFSEDGQPTDAFGIREYLSEILVLPDSPLIGKSIADSALGRDFDLTILRIVRNKGETVEPRSETVLQEGDLVLVEGSTDDILKIKETAGIDLKADVKPAEPNLDEKEVGLVEMIILPRSPLIGRTLKGQRFRERHGVQVLGINRHDESLRRKISMVPLRMGDVLLVQGRRARIHELAENTALRALGEVEVSTLPGRQENIEFRLPRELATS